MHKKMRKFTFFIPFQYQMHADAYASSESTLITFDCFIQHKNDRKGCFCLGVVEGIQGNLELCFRKGAP